MSLPLVFFDDLHLKVPLPDTVGLTAKPDDAPAAVAVFSDGPREVTAAPDFMLLIGTTAPGTEGGGTCELMAPGTAPGHRAVVNESGPHQFDCLTLAEHHRVLGFWLGGCGPRNEKTYADEDGER